jgi:hypothetical protein
MAFIRSVTSRTRYEEYLGFLVYFVRVLFITRCLHVSCTQRIYLVFSFLKFVIQQQSVSSCLFRRGAGVAQAV